MTDTRSTTSDTPPPRPPVVVVTLGDKTVAQIEVMDERQPEEDEDANALRQAAVAWNALTRADFTVGGRTFSAAECSDWWA